MQLRVGRGLVFVCCGCCFAILHVCIRHSGGRYCWVLFGPFPDWRAWEGSRDKATYSKVNQGPERTDWNQIALFIFIEFEHGRQARRKERQSLSNTRTSHARKKAKFNLRVFEWIRLNAHLKSSHLGNKCFLPYANWILHICKFRMVEGTLFDLAALTLIELWQFAVISVHEIWLQINMSD